MVVYANSGEINFKLNQIDEAMEMLYKTYTQKEPTKVLDFDGYRIEFPNWWFNVRKSNTEPYLRLVVEADSETLLKEKIEQLTAIIRSFT